MTKPRHRSEVPAEMEGRLNILYEDASMLILNKPAGLVCHPTKADGFSSLISCVRAHFAPAVTPQLINRLDRETSGVVVLAKEPVCARALRRLWKAGNVAKTYLAVVHGIPAATHAVIDAPLGKDEHSVVAIKNRVRPDGKPAQTEYWVERSFRRTEGEFALLRVMPRTGRKHQIRIHLAHAGHPIVGDKLYGGDETLYLAFVEGRLSETQRERLILPYQALHARSVAFAWRGVSMEFTAEPEPWFQSFTDGPVHTRG